MIFRRRDRDRRVRGVTGRESREVRAVPRRPLQARRALLQPRRHRRKPKNLSRRILCSASKTGRLSAQQETGEINGVNIHYYRLLELFPKK